MSEPVTPKQLIAEADSLAAFIEAAGEHDIPTEAQADALRRHVWGEKVPPHRATTILTRERRRLDESERAPFSASDRAPRYVDLDDLDLVSSYEFDHLLAAVLRRVDGVATVTAASADREVDVVWERVDETVGIRAVAVDATDPVGPRAVPGSHADGTVTDPADSVDVRAVVTTSRYTDEARAAAAESGVRLYGRTALADWLAEARLDAATMGEILDSI